MFYFIKKHSLYISGQIFSLNMPAFITAGLYKLKHLKNTDTSHNQSKFDTLIHFEKKENIRKNM